jgi:hypothetical protein
MERSKRNKRGTVCTLLEVFLDSLVKNKRVVIQPTHINFVGLFLVPTRFRFGNTRGDIWEWVKENHIFSIDHPFPITIYVPGDTAIPFQMLVAQTEKGFFPIHRPFSGLGNRRLYPPTYKQIRKEENSNTYKKKNIGTPEERIGDGKKKVGVVW